MEKEIKNVKELKYDISLYFMDKFLIHLSGSKNEFSGFFQLHGLQYSHHDNHSYKDEYCDYSYSQCIQNAFLSHMLRKSSMYC
jgi:hypothetical protein